MLNSTSTRQSVTQVMRPDNSVKAGTIPAQGWS